MSRIPAAFEANRSKGRKAFIPFITAGDPDLETSLEILSTLAAGGADIIELGVPFSDPMADGPTIQRSSQRALDRGCRLDDVLELARRFRQESDVPLVLFSYFNPILRMGIEEFCQRAMCAGIDGLLLTDVIEAEAAQISEVLAQADIDLISLVAPTTTDERLEDICRTARGFIYAIARAGVTGARDSVSSSAEELVKRTRRFTDLPIAVGFGISTAEQVAEVWRFADAAVVGSAIVAEIEKADEPRLAVKRVEEFISRLLPEVAKSGSQN